MKTITVEITPAGKVLLDVNGAKGPECLELTKAIEESLSQVIDRKEKPEIYESVMVSDSVTVGG